MLADFICEQLSHMCQQKILALTLSLVLHLGLLLVVGSLLPHSVGEGRIFQVYLAESGSDTAGGSSSPQQKAEPKLAQVSAAGEQTAASAPPTTAAGDQLVEEISKTSLANVADERDVQQQPPPEPETLVAEVVHILPAESKSILKPVSAGNNSVAQTISSPAASANDKGAKKEGIEAAGAGVKAPSTASHAVTGSSRQGLGKNYLAMVFAKIEAAKRYPRTAIRRRMEGSAEVVFRLDKKGGLLAVDLARSSGYHSLDQAAITAVSRAAPFPPLPEGGKTIPHALKITISFILSLKE